MFESFDVEILLFSNLSVKAGGRDFPDPNAAAGNHPEPRHTPVN
jgi:hypothetical protein